jgi:putative endonuclease
MKGYMYILVCADNTYYTGSTVNLERRLLQHQTGEGANYTRERLPVSLVYFEVHDRIDKAFYREKQVQGWSRRKKEALINGQQHTLPELSRSGKKQLMDSEVSPERMNPAVEPVETPGTALDRLSTRSQ